MEARTLMRDGGLNWDERPANLGSGLQVREWEECLTVLGGWDDTDADPMDVQVWPDELLLSHLPCTSCKHGPLQPEALLMHVKDANLRSLCHHIVCKEV